MVLQKSLAGLKPLITLVGVNSARHLKLSLAPCSTLCSTPLPFSGIIYQNKPPAPKYFSDSGLGGTWTKIDLSIFYLHLSKCVPLLLAVPLDVDITQDSNLGLLHPLPCFI